MDEGLLVRRAARLVGTIVYLGGAAFWAYLSAALVALRCDDACNETDDDGWWDDPNSWQWPYVGWFGLAGLLLALAALAASSRRRMLGVAFYCVHVIVFVAGFVFLESGASVRHPLDVDHVMVAVAVAVAGALAVGISTSPDHHGGASAERG